MSDQKKEKIYSSKPAFTLKMILSIALSFLSVVVIFETFSKSFGIVYNVIFIFFLIIVFISILQTNKQLKILDNFYNSVVDKGGLKGVDLRNKQLNSIVESYKKSFMDNSSNTRANADLYFGAETYLQDMNTIIPFHVFLRLIPGTFIGLGILGTFIGFSVGLTGLNVTDSERLMMSVQRLLDGIQSAFWTSIIGVIGSVWLNFVMIHPLYHHIEKTSKALCDKLDSLYYVTDADAVKTTINCEVPKAVKSAFSFDDPEDPEKRYELDRIVIDLREDIQNIKGSIDEMAYTLSEKLAESLQESLTDGVKSQLDLLKDELSETTTVLKDCREVFKNAPREFADATSSMSKTFRQMETKLNEIKDKYTQISDGIVSNQTQIDSTQTKMTQLLQDSNEMHSKSTEILDGMQKVAQEQNSQIKEAVINLTNMSAEYTAIVNQNKEILQGLQGLDQNLDSIFSKLHNNIAVYSDTIGKNLQEYLDGFSEATDGITKQLAESISVFRGDATSNNNDKQSSNKSEEKADK